mgnify:CR=1 FL=1|tara:strand:- start:2307 stop:2828 length:522 start_codon:yes stop_codon:yes gene_type:complete
MFQNLYKTGYVLSKLCTFSRSPEELPYSYGVMGFIATVMLSAKLYVLSKLPNLTIADSLQISLSYLLLLGLSLYFILKFQNKAERWHKVFMGLLGTQLLLFLVFYPFVLLQSSAQVIAGMMHNIWVFGVGGYIIHKGLGVRVFSGVLLVFVLELFANIPLTMHLIDFAQLADK